MDLKLVREKAIEETTRFFLDKHGILPDEDSDEWEAEYRRHFEQVKKRYAAGRSAEPAKIPTGGRVAAAGAALPEIKGAPAQKRWAESLRAERLKEIQNQETRSWLAGAWTSAEDWIDTREMAAAAFLRRVGAQFEAAPPPQHGAGTGIAGRARRKSGGGGRHSSPGRGGRHYRGGIGRACRCQRARGDFSPQGQAGRDRCRGPQPPRLRERQPGYSHGHREWSGGPDGVRNRARRGPRRRSQAVYAGQCRLRCPDRR